MHASLRALAFAVGLAPGLPALAHEAPQVKHAVFGGNPVTIATSGVDAGTPFAIASIGKTMTAVAVLRVLERKGIALDTPAARHLPLDVARLLDLEGVTIRHLLAMRSGLPDYYDDDFLDLVGDAPDGVPARDAIAHVADLPTLFDPGEDEDYSNTNYVLLGMMLEHLTGDLYRIAMGREVFDPAGMDQAFVFGDFPLPPSFPRGHEDGAHVRDHYARAQGYGDGGVIASARDVAAFYTALRRPGALLSPAAHRALFADPDGDGYGLGIEVSDWPIVGHSGGDLGFSSDARMDMESGDLAVILIGESDAETDWAFDMLTLD
ncbi:MAG: serine hydrolase domain-containing protein [Shimia sp.]